VLHAALIIKAVRQPFTFEGTPYTLGCSIGVSMFPADGNDTETLLKRADSAMYRAKAFAFAEAAAGNG